MADRLFAVASAFPAEIMERMQRGLHDARGTIAPETERAMRRAFTAFRRWCAGRGMSDLPATSESVATYADGLAAIPGRKTAGIKQSVWAIGAVHRLAKLPDPTKAETVRQALNRLSKELGTSTAAGGTNRRVRNPPNDRDGRHAPGRSAQPGPPADDA